jgi:HlyD family secretion protein
VKKLIAILVVLVAVGGVAGWYFRKSSHADQTALTLYGNVDIREVNLGFRVAGRLMKLECDEGDSVKAGQVIATLDDEPYRNQVANAKAQVGSLRARLQLREAGNRPQEIAQAKAVVREREVTAANAERLFQRADDLLATKAVSVQDRDNAEAAFREAQARLTSARESLALLEAGFRTEDIAQARADLAQAETGLATAELQAKDCVLTAPSNGIILTRAQESGAILSVGTTVFTLSLQQPVWIRAYVSETDLGRIHSGAKVAIYTDSRPDRPYSGQVGFISPRAEFTPKTVETPELRTSLVYRLRVVVSNPDEGLKQGMPATVRLTAKQ